MQHSLAEISAPRETARSTAEGSIVPSARSRGSPGKGRTKTAGFQKEDGGEKSGEKSDAAEKCVAPSGARWRVQARQRSLARIMRVRGGNLAEGPPGERAPREPAPASSQPRVGEGKKWPGNLSKPTGNRGPAPEPSNFPPASVSFSRAAAFLWLPSRE